MSLTNAESIRRLRWRCRRGMRELDALLMRFVDEHYAVAPRAQQQAFEALLNRPDPEILGLLMGRDRDDDPDLDDVVSMILAKSIH